MEKTPDVTVENFSSLFLFRPQTDTAKEWVAANVQLEDYQIFCGGFSVDHHYAYDLAKGMQSAGLVVV